MSSLFLEEGNISQWPRHVEISEGKHVCVPGSSFRVVAVLSKSKEDSTSSDVHLAALALNHLPHISVASHKSTGLNSAVGMFLQVWHAVLCLG